MFDKTGKDAWIKLIGVLLAAATVIMIVIQKKRKK